MTDGDDAAALKALRHQAVRLQARREHSRLELARKLARLGPQELVEQVLNELQTRGLLSDARFADGWIRCQGARLGAAKLRHTLTSKGVDADVMNAQLAAAALPDEIDRARQVWAKKFSGAPADAREWARQARFLQSRGFATDIIRRVLKDAGTRMEDDTP